MIASDTATPRADTRALAGCLEAFSRQQSAPPIELVVPYHGAVDGIGDLARRFPDVVFVPVDGPTGPSWTGERVHHHTLRARGLGVARGALLGLAEDHARPDPHWAATAIAAHRDGDWGGVAGAIENGVDRPLAWAAYFCDFARYQNPVPEGPSDLASDINVVYRREALEAVRAVWEGGFYEVIVNEALSAAGYRLALRRDLVMVQQRDGLRPRAALVERYAWGRSYAAVRSTGLPRARRVAYGLLSPLLPWLLTARIGALAWRRGRLRPFVRALPWILLLESAWSLGEGAGYLGSSDSSGGTSGA